LNSVSTLQAFQGSRLLAFGRFNFNVMGDEVVCTAAQDGSSRWKHKLPGNLAQSGGVLGAPPLAAGKSVLVAALAGDVLRFDAESGKLLATYPIGAPLRAQPVVEDGWIYAPTDDGRLVAFDTGDRSLTGWPMWGGNAARTGSVNR
jgi:outer membrane protein assembly factor BamB